MSTDEQLMRTFQDGHREAFDELFVRYQERVWGFFRRRTEDAEQAQELTQDTFLAVLRGAQRYEARATFRSYLFGIAFNVLSAARRRSPHAQEASLGSLDPAAVTPDPDVVLAVRQALAALDTADREILMLREYEALSYDEIAILVGVPVNTVRSRLFRARLALRARLTTPSETGAVR